jgi:hypothetical protein
MMEAVNEIKSRIEISREKEQFWRLHAKQQRESGLSRIAYCRKHQLSYEQLGYWEYKWRQMKVSNLLPVHLRGVEPKLPASVTQDLVCTVLLKSGHELKIHDKTILPFLLSALG